MGSRKGSAKAKRREEFMASLGGMDDVFAQESKRRQENSRKREAALRNKACESKNRYSSKTEAQLAIKSCEDHGTTGLRCYRCEYCNGWHLTSKKY